MENNEYENQVFEQPKSDNKVLQYVLMGLAAILLLCAGFYLGTQYKTDKSVENARATGDAPIATKTDTEDVVIETTEEVDKSNEVSDSFGIQYTNSEWGYQMNYPEGWTVGEEKIVLDRVNTIHSSIRIGSPDGTQWITVSVYDDDGGPALLTHPDFAPVVEEASIDGVIYPVSVFPGGYECYEAASRKDDCSFFHITIPRNTSIVTLQASGKAQTVSPEYKQILDTFTLLPFDETLPEQRIEAIPYDLLLASVKANQIDGENIVVDYLIDNNSAHKYEGDVKVVLRETFTKKVLATETVPGRRIMKDDFNVQWFKISAAKEDISVPGNIDVEIVIDPDKVLSESNHENNVSQIAPLL